MKMINPLETANVPPAEAGTPYLQRASLAELDALFATLQHRAFRGELGVPPSGGKAHDRKSA